MAHVWMPQNGCFYRHRSRFDLPVIPSDNVRSSLLDTLPIVDSVGIVHTDSNMISFAYNRLMKPCGYSEHGSVQCRDPIRSGLTFSVDLVLLRFDSPKVIQGVLCHYLLRVIDYIQHALVFFLPPESNYVWASFLSMARRSV